MDVQSIGAAAIAFENACLQDMQKPLAQAAPTGLPKVLPTATPAAGDVTTAFIADIAAHAEIAQVAALLEPQHSADVTTRITALSNDTAAALQVGDHARALSNVTEIAALDPHALDPLRTDKVLDPIRTEVDRLVNRLTTVAKMNAEGWLAQAGEVLVSPVQASAPNLPATLARLTQIAVPVLNPGAGSTAPANADVQSAPQARSPQTVARIVELTRISHKEMAKGHHFWHN